MRRWLCRIGIHEWIDTEQTTDESINCKVAEEFDPLKYGEHRACVYGRTLVVKMCLRCRKKIDEPKVYREKRRKQMRVLVDEMGLSALQPKKWRLPDIGPPPPSKSK